MATKIEWADLTINPTRGCQHCSPGCDNCYAERFAARLALNPKSGKSYAGLVDFKGKWTGRISDYDLSVFDRLPKTPKRIFVGSMTDLFFCGVNDTPRQALTTVEGTTYEFAPDIMHARLAMILIELGKLPQHTFMFLTKRPEAMRDVMQLMLNRPLPNLWLGVTVCNQAEADAKIPALLATPAVKRFVSIEPMLGPVDLTKIKTNTCTWDTLADNADNEGPAINWVICGGETGPDARPMHPDWVRGLRDQCKAAEVPFFFKSWGEWLPTVCVDFYRGEHNVDFVQKYGRTGREFPNSEGRAIISDGRVLLVDPPLKVSNTFREKYKLPCDYKPDGRNLLIDAEAHGYAHKCGLHEVGYQWMYCVGKKRAGRLLDGQEHNEIPEGK